MHVRAAVRFRLEKPPQTTLFVQDHGEHSIKLTDVSLKGCGFEAKQLNDLELGARVELRMPGPGPRSSWGRVRHVSSVAQGRGKLRYGVEFEKPLRLTVADAGGTYWAELQRKLALKDREIEKARHVAFHAPDIREDMVMEILAQIRQGRYHVTGADVAPKMIQEHWSDLRLWRPAH